MQLAPHFPGHPKEEQATREDQAYNAHQKAYGQCEDNPQNQRRTDTDQDHLAALRSRKACSKRADNNCRSEEHTSELQSLMRISYAVFCLKKKTTKSILSVE